MWEVLEVLRRHQRGESQRSIQKNTGKARKTVRRLVRTAKELGWTPSSGEPTEELAGAVYRCLRPGPKEPSRGASHAELLRHLDQIRSWIETDEVDVTKVQALLERRGVKVAYRTLHRFVSRQVESYRRRKTTVRMDTDNVPPGEIAEVDFGRMGLVPDPDRPGKKCLVHALVVTLVYSRHQYVHITRTQQFQDLIHGLEDAWEFFGGVPVLVVIDNMKAAVLKADRYDPLFQRMFDEYSKYRGFTTDATRSASPKDKPHVERQVPYVRKNFFQGEAWKDVAHVQRGATRWCLEVAGLRTHGTTRRRPVEVFEGEERDALCPLDRERYDPPRWKKLKVHEDLHIRSDHALYSVPYRYERKQVDVRVDSKLVRIYHDGEQIKTHPLKPPGRKSTDPADYPTELTPYTTRNPDRRHVLAQQVGPSTAEFIQQLLAPPNPWKNLRQADMVLGGLRKKYGDARLETACQRAVHFGKINAYGVKTILEKALDQEPEGQNTLFIQPSSRYARPASAFSHHTPQRKEASHDGGQEVAQDCIEAPSVVRNSTHAS